MQAVKAYYAASAVDASDYSGNVDGSRVKEAINELAHVYAELQLLGAGVEYIDVGGGLGFDYDGSRTNFASSMNYTLEEYANEIGRAHV